MLIPSKYSGYQAGIRLYPGGGGGGGDPVEQAPKPAAPPPPPPPAWANLGVNTEVGYGRLFNTADPTSGNALNQGDNYNSLLRMGFNDNAIRSSSEARFGAQSDANWNAMVQQAAMQSPTGRPMAGSGQFYQPVYRPYYQNYGMTNPFSISQYGQGGGYNPYMPQMQSAFNPYNYGPPQPIVSRSASVRGTPNVMMRRASGGIADLVSE